MGERGGLGVSYHPTLPFASNVFMSHSHASSGHMSAPQKTVRPSEVLLPAMERLGIPVFLFGVVFLLAMFLLTLVVRPDRFPVRVGDKVLRLSDLAEEQRILLSQKVDLEVRADPLSAARAPVLRQVTDLRRSFSPVGRVLLSIDDVRAAFTTKESDPISLPSVSVSGSGSVIVLGGEVRGQGGSMQILASFIDGLRAISVVESVTEPEYKEYHNTDGTVSSPFSITLTLRHAQY